MSSNKAAGTRKKNRTTSATAKGVAASPEVTKAPKRSGQPTNNPEIGRKTVNWRQVVASVGFARLYAAGALMLLLATTVLWAYLGARLQQNNADQLANTFLSQNATTFRNATFPGQHTFLVKWPLFWLIAAFGSTSAAFIWITVGTVVATVGLLALLLFRIVREPLRLGTLYLALASILLAIPAQPYPGGILPVNMAMVTTRNLEYIIYIAALILFVSTYRFRSWRFWVGASILALLAASDKLFLSLTIGGALAACVVYGLWRRWKFVTLTVQWVVFGVVAAVIASGILWGVSQAGWTHIASGTELSPFGYVHTARDVVLGSVYAGLGLLTNMGANPSGDTRLLAALPRQAWHAYTSWGGITFTVNLALTALAVFAIVRLLRWSLHRHQPNDPGLGLAARLALTLLWATTAACAIFVVSNHYYPVDARYLTIALFAAAVIGAVVLRSTTIRTRLLLLAGIVLSISIAAGLPNTIHTYNAQQAAVAPTAKRNTLIAQALHQHQVHVLVGDYWRVLPTRLASEQHLAVMPLSDCTTPRHILSSSSWQPNLNKTSFAYLLSLDASLTNSPKCNLATIIAAYGKPNASTLVSGTLTKPQELLLFYDRGAHRSAPSTPNPVQSAATVVPITADSLPYTVCSEPTIMNVVAHQDDDLLFMNPDLLHDIHAGHCVRTIYITAGDAGVGSYYWLSRERGAEAAYATMVGTNVIWVQRILKLANNSFVTVANPKGNPRISLIFMHLPDGDLKGKGFVASHFESLDELEDGHIPAIHSIDNSSKYTAEQLTATLTQLMSIYQPTEIRTQAEYTTKAILEHSDHMQVGRFTTQAYHNYEAVHFQNTATIPIRYYLGYPIRGMAENIAPDDLALKEDTLLAYAQYDKGVCQSVQACASKTNNYSAYLRRQYTTDE